MLVSLTVGKVDAGVTVLLTPDKRLVKQPLASLASQYLRISANSPPPDRVPLHPPPTQHLLRQHSRHQRLAKQHQRNGRRNQVPHPSRAHLQLLRRLRALHARPPLPQRNPNLRRPRMGPRRARYRRPHLPQPVPQWPKGRQHPPPAADAQHQD